MAGIRHDANSSLRETPKIGISTSVKGSKTTSVLVVAGLSEAALQGPILETETLDGNLHQESWHFTEASITSVCLCCIEASRICSHVAEYKLSSAGLAKLCRESVARDCCERFFGLTRPLIERIARDQCKSAFQTEYSFKHFWDCGSRTQRILVMRRCPEAP